MGISEGRCTRTTLSMLHSSSSSSSSSWKQQSSQQRGNPIINKARRGRSVIYLTRIPASLAIGSRDSDRLRWLGFYCRGGRRTSAGNRAFFLSFRVCLGFLFFFFLLFCFSIREGWWERKRVFVNGGRTLVILIRFDNTTTCCVIILVLLWFWFVCHTFRSGCPALLSWAPSFEDQTQIFFIFILG